MRGVEGEEEKIMKSVAESTSLKLKKSHLHREVYSPIIYNILWFLVLGSHDILSGFSTAYGCYIIP